MSRTERLLLAIVVAFRVDVDESERVKSGVGVTVRFG